MNPYSTLVEDYARLLTRGKHLPLATLPARPPVQPATGTPTVMIFSPHPDDEVIIGGLALRLMRESGWRCLNVAVTHGSKLERRAARVAELERCCAAIGFELVHASPSGLGNITPAARERGGDHWTAAVAAVRAILDQHRPGVILAPHDQDSHPAHIGTHFLVMDALGGMAPDYEPYVVETEFWGQMPGPNLMVALRPEDVADLICALTFHVGEVQRNPYHLSLPAWMIDNVRRGSELVGGHGAGARDFVFATLYRLRRRSRGNIVNVLASGRALGTDEPAETLFPLG